jgi:hypothetical protein
MVFVGHFRSGEVLFQTWIKCLAPLLKLNGLGRCIHVRQGFEGVTNAVC